MYKKSQFIIMVILVTVITCGIILGVHHFTMQQDYSVIETIQHAQVKPNVFIDYGMSIDVQSAEDLGFILKDSCILLHYGHQVIDIKYSSLSDPEFIDALGSIGIEVFQHDGSYKFTYWGEEIDEWVHIS